MLYAIGDIHGCLKLLEQIYNKILDDIKITNDPTGNIIIFVGDYIDRGSASKEVLNCCMNLKDSNNLKHIFLKGNHEDFLETCYQGYGDFYCWMQNGGEQTLLSFGFDPKDIHLGKIQNSKILKSYYEWIKNLPYYYEVHNYFFCHSGWVDFNKPLELQKEALLWGRPSDNRYKNSGKIVICGHTIRREPIIRGNLIRIDTGSYYYGKITAAVLPNTPLTAEYDVRFLQTS